MDRQTIQFYEYNAAACAARYENADVSSLHRLLRAIASPRDRVLEIGGGSGRDAAFLVSLGCRVLFTDASRSMLKRALNLHPELSRDCRIAVFPLADTDPLLQDRFSLILGLAIIMHLNDVQFQRFAKQLSTMLAAGGRVIVSHSQGRGRLLQATRDQHGRLFVERPAAVVSEVFDKAGLRLFRKIETTDALLRKHLTWVTQVFFKPS